MRVVILGAGFGGLELARTLSDEAGDALDVVLVDRSAEFVFGFSKLDVMFGRATAEHVRHSYADLQGPGLRFVQADVLEIDPATRRVVTTAETFDADVLVVALGADVHPEATPGLLEAGHEFYSVAGAVALRQVLEDFEGGRVLVGVTSTPFKCPPAPSEAALLTHELLAARGLLERSSVSLVMPLGAPIPPSPAASKAVLSAFAARGIAWHPNLLVRGLDPARKTALLSDDSELPFDLFLGVPVHRPPRVVLDSGLATDGWVAVDPRTLETAFPGVYAVGDVTSIGTPKAGQFAEGQASVVAAAVLARLRGTAAPDEYRGHGLCYLDMGDGEVAKVEVTFLAGHTPEGSLEGPSAELAAAKDAFGSARIRRWFGRDWSAVP